MKVKSDQLEVRAIISHKEMENLANHPLVGTLHYREDETKRKISFSLVTNATQKTLVEVTQEPEDYYFGHATKTIFSINPQFYEALTTKGHYEGRFYGITGKLEVEVTH